MGIRTTGPPSGLADHLHATPCLYPRSCTPTTHGLPHHHAPGWHRRLQTLASTFCHSSATVFSIRPLLCPSREALDSHAYPVERSTCQSSPIVAQTLQTASFSTNFCFHLAGRNPATRRVGPVGSLLLLWSWPTHLATAGSAAGRLPPKAACRATQLLFRFTEQHRPVADEVIL